MVFPALKGEMLCIYTFELYVLRFQQTVIISFYSSLKDLPQCCMLGRWLLCLEKEGGIKSSQQSSLYDEK